MTCTTVLSFFPPIKFCVTERSQRIIVFQVIASAGAFLWCTCLRGLLSLHHDVVGIFYRPHVATKYLPTPQLVVSSLLASTTSSPEISELSPTSLPLHRPCSDGSRLPLSINKIGSTEILTKSLLHSEFPNDRFRDVVCNLKNKCYFGD